MTSERRPPGRPRRADLRVPTDVAIVTAATALFMEKGYRSVTIEMVAEAAGVTKPAVYYHFKDKSSLLVATTEAVFKEARRATGALLAAKGPLRQRLQRIAEVVLALPQPFTQFDTMMHEAATELSAEQLTQIREEEQAVYAVVEDAMAQAAESGEIVAPDPQLAAHAFLALLRLGQMRGEDGRHRFPDTTRTAQLLVSALWEGIGAPHAG